MTTPTIDTAATRASDADAAARADAADRRATAEARALAADRLRATRRALLAAAGGRAALWAAAAGVTAAAVVRWTAGPGAPVAAWAAGAAVAAGALAAARAGGPGAWTLAGVALWVEARVAARAPALRYALVTLADGAPNDAPLPAPVARALAERVRAVSWRGEVARAARRALGPPAGALLAAFVLLAAAVRWPARADAGPGLTAAGGASAVAARGAPADPLARVRATVTPPAYARRPARTLDDPAGVAALVGSALAFEGAGGAGQVRAFLVDAGGGAPGAPGVAALGGTLGGSAGASLGAGATAARPRPLAVRAAGGGRWRVLLPMPAAPALVRLSGPARDRLVVLEPQPDLAPRVVLELPARDTVVRAPAEGPLTGLLRLRARAADDLGLADGAFEYVVSSGEGENFTFRSGRLGAARLAGAERATLAAAADLSALGLKPGDVVHLRAVARDGRPSGAAGPALGMSSDSTLGAPPPAGRDAQGASETRTLRVARAGEYDSLAVEGAPPPTADTTAVGQRMLLQLTEALVARARARPPLAREAVVAESRRIAGDQARLRRRVGDLVFARAGGPGEEAGGEHAHFEGDGHNHAPTEKLPTLTPDQMLAAASRATGGTASQLDEGGESPVVAVNRPLLEAYNHMWDAGRALEVAEPANALAPMRRAIAALQRARAAERVYLRGRPPAVVVDVEKVRLAGGVRGDTLRPAARDPRAALDPAARARAAALDRALAGLARPGTAGTPAGTAGEAARRDAADSLALLRVRALGEAPALAAALGDALAALARGADPTAALARARRAALAPAAPGGARGGTAGWAGAWADLRP